MLSAGRCYHPPVMADENGTTKKPSESPLSLSRLRHAFATMLGEQKASGTEQSNNSNPSPQPPAPSPARCEINPRSVVEAILFVGRPDNGSFSSRELAAAMRGVSPAEIETAVNELNAIYETDGAPYVIDSSKAGFRLTLRDGYARTRDKFHGNVREAKLSPAAMEVLSIVAYNQPITANQINEIRNAPNGAALSTLVRRGIVRLDRPADKSAQPQYSTTDRFLKLFSLESLDALPRSEELEKV
jgi:segregation and condensation protein B